MVNKYKAEKKERNRRFKLWTKQVKERDRLQCCICGETKMLNAHHIIPREVHALRFNVRNGISLCPLCHQFSRKISAHHNSFVFFLWLRDNRPEQFEYLERFIYSKDTTSSIKDEVTL